MSLLSPFNARGYDVRDHDLVRFVQRPTDDSLSVIVRSIFDSLDEHRSEVRQALDEEERGLLALFARRSALIAARTRSQRALSDALDAYALLMDENDIAWESWFKATLFIGREIGLDLEDAHRRFSDGATPKVAQRGDVAFDAMARISDIAQCHVIEVSTTYGLGLLQMTVVRDQGTSSWGGITGQAVSLGQYRVGYAPTANVAQMAVTISDALDASGLALCTYIRQDQLVATAFDLVTAGSYLESSGCVSFIAEGVDGHPSAAFTIAELTPERIEDETLQAADHVTEDTQQRARELAETADAIEDQAAFAVGTCVVVLSAIPDFSDEALDKRSEGNALSR
jgi:hypothetical protein